MSIPSTNTVITTALMFTNGTQQDKLNVVSQLLKSPLLTALVVRLMTETKHTLEVHELINLMKLPTFNSQIDKVVAQLSDMG